MTDFNPENPQPGLYFDMPADQYHKAPGLSKGLLDAFAKTPIKYKRALQGIKKQSREFDIGSATHLLVLEPEKFDSQVVCGPADRRGNKWKEAKENNPDKIVLTESEYEMVQDMRDAVFAHPDCQWLLNEGDSEVSCFWNEPITQQLCRCRSDFMRSDGILVDVKTVQENYAGQEEFSKHILNYNYHIQAAMYCDGFSRITNQKYESFIFIVVEKVQDCCPELVAVHHIEPMSFEIGKIEYMEKLQAFKRHFDLKDGDRWDGYPRGVQETGLPDWYIKRYEKVVAL